MKIVLTELFFSTDANGGADLALNLVPSHVEVERIPALQWQGRGSCHLYREELQERMEASPATGMGSKDQHPVVPRCHCLPKGTKHLLHQPAEHGRLTSWLTWQYAGGGIMTAPVPVTRMGNRRSTHTSLHEEKHTDAKLCSVAV